MSLAQNDESSATVLRFDNVIGPETGQYEYAYETSNGIKEEVRFLILSLESFFCL